MILILNKCLNKSNWVDIQARKTECSLLLYKISLINIHNNINSFFQASHKDSKN